MLPVPFGQPAPGDLFHQYGLFFTDKGLTVPAFVYFSEFPHHQTPLLFHLLRNLVGHPLSPCPPADGVFEGMDMTEAYLPDHPAGLLKVFPGFSRETYHDVGGEIEQGMPASELFDNFQIR